MKKRLPVLLALLLISVFRLSAQSGSVTLHFVFRFQGKPLETGQTYTTAAGESIQVDQVRFYVGEPRAVATAARPPETNSPNDYWLIDSKDSASFRITFPVEADLNFSGVAFQIGVDSANQVRGARTGSLDPLRGMYWTWNSGYVAVKIEGHSSAAATAGGQLEYHLGGYRSPHAVRTLIQLKSTHPFSVAARSSLDLTLPIDLDRFFPATFSVKKMPAMMTPGPVSIEMMKRFRDCFLPVVLNKSGF